jgi:putative Mg2+ transporter-C (MgtC) family protein
VTLAVVPSLTWWELLARIALAAVLGGAIGLERELRDHEAGLRTHMLVAVGSALFTIMSAYGFHDFLVAGGVIVRTDPTRIAAQIVTGIGFLGAGTIIRQGVVVRGLTTAATLWVVAAIGLASGGGDYVAAVLTTVVAVFLLGPMRLVGRLVAEVQPTHRLAVRLAPGSGPAGVIERIESLGAKVASFSVDEEGNAELELKLPGRLDAATIVRALADHADVRSAEWL